MQLTRQGGLHSGSSGPSHTLRPRHPSITGKKKKKKEWHLMLTQISHLMSGTFTLLISLLVQQRSKIYWIPSFRNTKLALNSEHNPGWLPLESATMAFRSIYLHNNSVKSNMQKRQVKCNLLVVFFSYWKWFTVMLNYYILQHLRAACLSLSDRP